MQTTTQRYLQILGGMNADAERLNALTEQIIGAAIEVHRVLGPGLLESAYEACMYYQLVTRGLSVERQKALPLVYGDVRLDCAYRMDLVVETPSSSRSSRLRLSIVCTRHKCSRT